MPYNAALDGLRAVAVLLVIAFHCRVPGVPGGFFGVDVFFVLSGFLITSLLLNELAGTGRIDLGRFCLRRAMRLTPALMLMLAGYLALAPLLWPAHGVATHARDVALALAYVADYARALTDAPDLLSHTWSLAVEAKFYLLWPLALPWLLRGRQAAIMPLILLYALATQWRLTNLALNADWDLTYYRFDTHASGLVMGALLALAIERLRAWPRRVTDAIGLTSLGVLGLCATRWRWLDTGALGWGIVAVETASAGLILGASARASAFGRALAWTPLAGIGLISYGLYLWHYPIARLLRDLTDWPATLAATLALSLALAGASYLWVERPLQRYRRQLRPQTAGRAAGPQKARTPVRAFRKWWSRGESNP